MDSLFSLFFFLLLPLGVGVLTIYLSVDLFEYLKQYHPAKYRQMSFNNLFGMSGDNSFLYMIKPQEYFRFLLEPADMQDTNIKMYKKKIKLSLAGLLGLFVIYLLWAIIT
jgi:hypothetical protein